MIRRKLSDGVYFYEQELEDLQREALLALAQMQVQALGDEEAAKVAALFPMWAAGAACAAGERIADPEGRLYRVVQGHTAQEGWEPACTPSLFTPLGVTAEHPEEVPPWRQPLGGHDAYAKGDRVTWNGNLYESLIAANVYPPDGEFWTQV